MKVRRLSRSKWGAGTWLMGGGKNLHNRREKERYTPCKRKRYESSNQREFVTECRFLQVCKWGKAKQRGKATTRLREWGGSIVPERYEVPPLCSAHTMTTGMTEVEKKIADRANESRVSLGSKFRTDKKSSMGKKGRTTVQEHTLRETCLELRLCTALTEEKMASE